VLLVQGYLLPLNITYLLPPSLIYSFCLIFHPCFSIPPVFWLSSCFMSILPFLSLFSRIHPPSLFAISFPCVFPTHNPLFTSMVPLLPCTVNCSSVILLLWLLRLF
jgi:hypothetical protein